MDTHQEKAGFWIRLGAWLLDALILLAASLVLGVILKDRNFISTIAGALYAILFWVKNDGQTPCKKALGLKVVRVDGKPIDWMTAVLRYLGYIVSAIPIGLGFIWIAIDKDKQGFHDKIAGTYVVKLKK